MFCGTKKIELSLVCLLGKNGENLFDDMFDNSVLCEDVLYIYGNIFSQKNISRAIVLFCNDIRLYKSVVYLIASNINCCGAIDNRFVTGN